MKEYSELTFNEKVELAKNITQDEDFNDIMHIAMLLIVNETINKK